MRSKGMAIPVALYVMCLFLTSCILQQPKPVVVLQPHEILKTAPDYPGKYLIHKMYWEYIQGKLKAFRESAGVQIASSYKYEETKFPDYYAISATVLLQLAAEGLGLKQKIKIKALDNE